MAMISHVADGERRRGEGLPQRTQGAQRGEREGKIGTRKNTEDTDGRRREESGWIKSWAM